MDALIYTVMSGAERAMRAQQVHANNLANLETTGFRADLELAKENAVSGSGYDARHLSQLEANAVTTRGGTVRETGRDLDVAVQGDGLLAVQWKNGEAYTRAGNLAPNEEGMLMVNGMPVLGDGGPIVLPPHSKVSIAQDGTISILAPGADNMQAVDRLKLVRLDGRNTAKNEAGLIVPRDGVNPEMDETVAVRAGHLEGSNVSAVEEMVATMSLNREFEIQMKLFKAADSMAENGNRLLRE